MSSRPPRRAAAAITNYFTPDPASNASKRKAPNGDDDGSEKENSAPPPQKKTKANARNTAVEKANTAKGPTPQKLFNDTVKTMAKKVKQLDKAVQKLDPNYKFGIHIDSYVDIATSHLKDVEELAENDVALAWNLVLHLGDVAAPDLDRHFRLCGHGEHEEGFAELDGVLLKLIEKRTLPETRATVLPEVRHRWTMKDANVGEFKTGRPNKQQRNKIANDRVTWEAVRREERMKRRAECEDWVKVALGDLKGERDYLDQYGVEGFFQRSIEKLQGLEEGREGSEA